MMTCAYCEREATMRIVANPEHVCLEHAVEFWRGLLGFTKENAPPAVPVEAHESSCSCQSCEELSAAYLRAVAAAAAFEESTASARHAIAIAAAGPSPTEDELYP